MPSPEATTHNTKVEPWAELIGLLFLFALLLGGVGLFGWQTVTWLRTGVWESVSVLDFIAWGAPDSEWIRNPTDWVAGKVK